MVGLFEAFNYGLQATNPSQGEWGIGQQQPKTRVYHPRERGRETSAFEMVPAPFPATALKRAPNPKVADTQSFSQHPQVFRGWGKEPSQTPKFLSPPPLVRLLLPIDNGGPNPSISLAGGILNTPTNPNLKAEPILTRECFPYPLPNRQKCDTIGIENTETQIPPERTRLCLPSPTFSP